MAADLGQFVFEAAVVEAEIVLDGFIASQTFTLRHRQALHQAPTGLVATADDPDLAAFHQIVHGAQGVFVACAMVRPVGLVEVDVVGAQAAQAGLDSADDVVTV